VDDLQLIQVIENETDKLSAEGKEVWKLMESSAELNESGSQEFTATLSGLQEQQRSLSSQDRYTIKRLIKLTLARKTSNSLEESCADKSFASDMRWRGIIEAAQWKDKEAGRHIDLDMTVPDALSKLGYS
jgi:hypothetical protein